MALDLVSQKPEFLNRRASFGVANNANNDASGMMMTSLWTPSRLLSLSVADLTLDESLPPPDLTMDLGGGLDDTNVPPKPPSSSLNLRVKAVLQTPVIVLPRTPKSPEVLMAHLGRIVIENSSETKKSENVLGTLDEADEEASPGGKLMFHS